MCASVCPSQALWYGTRDEFDATRVGVLEDEVRFGRQTVRTKVRTVTRMPGPLDVLDGGRRFRWQDDPFGLAEDGDG